MKLSSLYQNAIHLLKDLSPTPQVDAEYLLCHVLGKNRSFLIAHGDEEISVKLQEEFEHLLSQRVQGKPVAYLIGIQGFWKHDFIVTPATLIPRPETELIISTTLSLLDTAKPMRILDLGTGSGAIAISLALESHHWQVIATDFSKEALSVARQNAKRLSAINVSFIESNWFESIQGRFDLIISNPPYIAETDPHLCEGDLRFEPRSALASGETGLEAIHTIIHHAPRFLSPLGVLMLEHGFEQAPMVQTFMQQTGYYPIETFKDLQGHPRVTIGHANFLVEKA